MHLFKQTIISLIILSLGFINSTYAQICLGLHKQGDYVSFAAPLPTPAAGTTFTVTAWVKFASGQPVVFVRDGSMVLLASAGKINFYCHNGSEAKIVESSSTYDDYQWHSVIGVRNEISVELYVDGLMVASASFSKNTPRGYQISQIGKSDVAAQDFKGLIKGVRLYSKALTAADAAALYNNGVFQTGAAEPGLVAGYDLTEGEGVKINDFSGNNRSGTIRNPNGVYANWFDGDRITPKTFYVHPLGAKTSNGASPDAAWNLAYALSHPPEVSPGDTIVIADDSTFAGSYKSYLTGTAAKRIKVQAQSLGKYPSPVQIDAATMTASGAALKIYGKYVDYFDIKAFNSNPSRYSRQPTTLPTDIIINDGFAIYGSNIRLINPVAVNNSGNGLTAFTPAGNVEVFNLYANGNGWRYPTFKNKKNLLKKNLSAAGNGIYIHNDKSTVTLSFRDFVTFNPYNYAAQHYADNSTASYNLKLDGLIAQNGEVAIVGALPKYAFALSKIFTYNGGVTLGQSGESNRSVKFDDSVLYAPIPLTIRAWKDFAVTNSTFVGKAANNSAVIGFAQIENQPLSHYIFSGNVYYRGRTGGYGSGDARDRYFYISRQNGSGVAPYNFAEWRAMGFDTDSVYKNQPDQTRATRPTGIWTKYLPHSQMPGRGLFAVYNWDLSPTVNIDLSSFGLTDQQDYKIYNLENPEAVFASGTYKSAAPVITIATASNGVLPWTNDEANTPPPSLPEFGAFLVVPVAVSGSETARRLSRQND